LNFSISEIVVIVLIALLVIKPDQLPEVAQSIGRFALTIRRLFAKVKDEMQGLIEPIEKPVERKRE